MTDSAVPSQADVLAWVRSRWPDRCTPERRALKLGEEAGEVLGAVNRLDEGRGTAAHVGKEVAQTILCALAVAESVGVDANEAIQAEWSDLQGREWEGALPPTESFLDCRFYFHSSTAMGFCPRCGGSWKNRHQPDRTGGSNGTS